MAVSVVNVVKAKGVVSYLEVGDQLVRKLLASKGKGVTQGVLTIHRRHIATEGYSDEKNVRRRVYDALNVLKAADIIVQGPGRDLMWRGLPNSSSDPAANAQLHELRARKRALLEQTKRQLDNVVVGRVVALPASCARLHPHTAIDRVPAHAQARGPVQLRAAACRAGRRWGCRPE